MLAAVKLFDLLSVVRAKVAISPFPMIARLYGATFYIAGWQVLMPDFGLVFILSGY